MFDRETVEVLLYVTMVVVIMWQELPALEHKDATLTNLLSTPEFPPTDPGSPALLESNMKRCIQLNKIIKYKKIWSLQNFCMKFGHKDIVVQNEYHRDYTFFSFACLI